MPRLKYKPRRRHLFGVDKRTIADGSEYSADEWEFICRVREFQTTHNRKFPTWAEVYDILISLGYRKVTEPSELPKPRSRGLT